MKGIFYSIVTIMFVTPLVLFTFVYLDSVAENTGILTTKTAGDKLASYSSSVEDDLPRAVNIIARRAVESSANYVDTNGLALSDSESSIIELMSNGTLNGNLTNQGFTFSTWVSDLKQKGGSYGFSTDVGITDINVRPLDPYNIQVNVSIFVNMSDRSGTMNFYRVYTTARPVSVEDVIDPLYTLNTNGLLKRTILRPNMTVSGVQAVDISVASRFYMNSSAGPSFLERLEGKLTRAVKYENYTWIGLETFVNLPELQANGLPVKGNQSSLEYLYFSSSAFGGQLVNQSSYNWLRLGAGDAARYGVTLLP